MWAGTWCCNGTTQLCHWKKQAHLPSDSCSQHSFAELFPSEMWIYCLKNMHEYVIQSATALPCHVTLKGEQKKEWGWKDIAQSVIVLYPEQPFVFETFWFISILWPFVWVKLTLWDAWWRGRVGQKGKPVLLLLQGYAFSVGRPTALLSLHHLAYRSDFHFSL